MQMEQEKIDRLGALARKAKEGPLTPEEEAERALLRRAYIDAVRASLEGQLENAWVVGPDGEKRRLEKKEP